MSVAASQAACQDCKVPIFRGSTRCNPCSWKRRSGPSNANWKGGKLKLVCKQCEQPFERFPSQRSECCSRECKQEFGLVTIECAWPNCETTMKARTIESKRAGRVYKTDLTKGGDYQKHPICNFHRERFRLFCGDSQPTRALNSFWLIAQREHQPRVGRGVGKLLSFVVWERQDGVCADPSCSHRFEFSARARPGGDNGSDTWQCDHIKPVFEGGDSSLDNLQALCFPCHEAKSRTEKSRAARMRHKRTSAGYRTTGHEKNIRLRELTAELDAMKSEVAELRKATLLLFAIINAQRANPCQS